MPLQAPIQKVVANVSQQRVRSSATPAGGLEFAQGLQDLGQGLEDRDKAQSLHNSREAETIAMAELSYLENGIAPSPEVMAMIAQRSEPDAKPGDFSNQTMASHMQRKYGIEQGYSHLNGSYAIKSASIYRTTAQKIRDNALKADLRSEHRDLLGVRLEQQVFNQVARINDHTEVESDKIDAAAFTAASDQQTQTYASTQDPRVQSNAKIAANLNIRQRLEVQGIDINTPNGHLIYREMQRNWFSSAKQLEVENLLSEDTKESRDRAYEIADELRQSMDEVKGDPERLLINVDSLSNIEKAIKADRNVTTRALTQRAADATELETLGVPQDEELAAIQDEIGKQPGVKEGDTLYQLSHNIADLQLTAQKRREFNDTSFEQRRQRIIELSKTPKTADNREDLILYGELSKAYEATQTAITEGDGIDQASREFSDIKDMVQPIDWANPDAEVIRKRITAAQMASDKDHYNIDIAPFTKGELASLGRYLQSQSPDDAMTFLAQFRGDLGDSLAPTVGGMIDAGYGSLAVALYGSEGNNSEVARKVVEGMKIRSEQGSLYERTKEQQAKALNDAYGNTADGLAIVTELGTDVAAFMDAADAIYIQKRSEVGETTWDPDTYSQSLKEALGGTVSVNGKTTILPRPGMDEDRFYSKLETISPEDFDKYAVNGKLPESVNRHVLKASLNRSWAGRQLGFPSIHLGWAGPGQYFLEQDGHQLLDENGQLYVIDFLSYMKGR